VRDSRLRVRGFRENRSRVSAHASQSGPIPRLARAPCIGHRTGVAILSASEGFCSGRFMSSSWFGSRTGKSLHFELTRHPTEGWAALLAVTFRGNSDPSVTLAAWDWGPMLAARHVWRELGRAWPERRDATPLSDRALVLVANRLAAPGSEAGLPTARIVEKPPTGCGARCSRTVRSLRAAGSDADQCHG
jgi:hypothetical protein